VTASSANSLRKILRSWPHHVMRRFFEADARLPLVIEEATGKLFPVANKSRAVRDALHALAVERGAVFCGNTEVVDLAPIGAGRWRVVTRSGAGIEADAVVLATGGLSVPKTGSDGFGLRLLASLGHTMRPTYPALTPLTLDPPRFADLAGVSLGVTIRARSTDDEATATGGFLFTHRGYSGPALLDVSHVAVRGRLAGAPSAALEVAWQGTSVADWTRRLAPAANQIATVLRRDLPRRLADRLIAEAAVDGETATAQLDRPGRERLLRVLTAFPLPWTADEGYRKAEVTGGGLDLAEVDPLTLQSRLHPGLFVAGEVLDAFGPIGGYNFSWAWVTGRAAGLGAARTIE
jgi:predicted Rossmann fold flavoprotein